MMNTTLLPADQRIAARECESIPSDADIMAEYRSRLLDSRANTIEAYYARMSALDSEH